MWSKQEIIIIILIVFFVFYIYVQIKINFQSERALFPTSFGLSWPYFTRDDCTATEGHRDRPNSVRAKIRQLRFMLQLPNTLHVHVSNQSTVWRGCPRTAIFVDRSICIRTSSQVQKFTEVNYPNNLNILIAFVYS